MPIPINYQEEGLMEAAYPLLDIESNPVPMLGNNIFY